MPFALGAWTSEAVACRGMMLPAHALLKQASSQGVIAARADFRVHVPRSAGACGQCGARGGDTVGPDASRNARVSQGGGVAYRTSSVASTGQPVGVRMGSVLATLIGCICLGTARDLRAGMRAEAYRSMADERGQLCHLQAAVWQVLVGESRREARIRRASRLSATRGG